MAYKSILSVLTDVKLADAPLQQAISMARTQDAHLDVLCLGLNRSFNNTYYGSANAVLLHEALMHAQAEAEEIEAFVNKAVKATDIRYGVSAEVAQLGDLGHHVARAARFADLVILPRPYGEGHGVEIEPVVESALFEGHAPVLVVPDEAAPLAKPGTVLIGWNESAESLAATRAALPLLREAEKVHVVVIDPPRHGPERSDPGGMLSQMLARHGVNCEVDVLGKTLTRVSDVLARHIVDTGADLLVMGAYGHSRFREAVLGGATRYMLERAAIPVFMAR